MAKGAEESRRRGRLPRAALTSAGIHVALLGLLIGRADVDEELVPISLVLDPGREVRGLAGDGLPPADQAGGSELGEASRAAHTPVVVDVLPPAPRREARAPSPARPDEAVTTAAAPPVRPLDATRATPASTTVAYQPLFVPAAASAEEVERIWKMRVLDQQLVVTRQALAAFTDREVEVREPAAARPAPARGGAAEEELTSGPGAEDRGAGAAAHGSGAGPASAGSGPGSGAAERRLQARIGGRVASGSRVSRAPRLGDELRGWCRTGGGRNPRAVIRLLVDTKGAVGSAFVLRASGDRTFDACALGFVRGARFEPGLDAAEHPLNVWLHAYVTTSACGESGCQAQLRLGE
jgi:TonB family protein